MQIDSAIERIEEKLLQLGQREVISSRIGELVMRELKSSTRWPIRYASVYRSFEDIDEFRALVDEVRKQFIAFLIACQRPIHGATAILLLPLARDRYRRQRPAPRRRTGHMAQRVVHQHQGQQRRQSGAAYAHTGIVGALAITSIALAVDVDGIARADDDELVGFDGQLHLDVPPGADAAQHPAGVVAGKALGRERIAMHRAALGHAGKARANLPRP